MFQYKRELSESFRTWNISKHNYSILPIKKRGKLNRSKKKINLFPIKFNWIAFRSLSDSFIVYSFLCLPKLNREQITIKGKLYQLPLLLTYKPASVPSFPTIITFTRHTFKHCIRKTRLSCRPYIVDNNNNNKRFDINQNNLQQNRDFATKSLYTKETFDSCIWQMSIPWYMRQKLPMPSSLLFSIFS